MQEFTLNIAEAINAGLRRDQRLRRNSNTLTECFNLLPTTYGLESYSSATDPFSGLFPTDAFPFPQIFIGKNVILLCYEDLIYNVDDNWVTTLITTYDYASPNTIKAIPAGGGVWHFDESGDSWYLSNGNSTVFKTGLDSINNLTDRIFVNTNITVKTGIRHKGRWILGGFDSANFWNSTWQTILSGIQADNNDLTIAFDDIDTNWVMWSSIAGTDFPFWLHYPEGRYTQYDPAPLLPDIQERARENTMGWLELPRKGVVNSIHTLGENVIVCSEGGIWLLNPVSIEYAPSTFGVRELFPLGTAQRGHAIVGEGILYFIARNGELYLINEELQLERLNYSEYIDSTTVLSFNARERHLYLSSATACYVFTRVGMGQVRQITPGLAYDLFNDRTVGVVSNLSGTTNSEGRIATETLTFSRPALKRITAINATYTGTGTVSVAVDYRYKPTEAYTRSRFVTLNNEGAAELHVAGKEFRVVVKVTDFSDFILDEMQVKWQNIDNRQRRGPNA